MLSWIKMVAWLFQQQALSLNKGASLQHTSDVLVKAVVQVGRG